MQEVAGSTPADSTIRDLLVHTHRGRDDRRIVIWAAQPSRQVLACTYAKQSLNRGSMDLCGLDSISSV